MRRVKMKYPLPPEDRIASLYSKFQEEALNNSANTGTEISEKYDRAKELLKLATDTINHNLHKSCCNCSHFTSDRNCDIGKYLYGTGEKECEWEWKHMGEIRKFLHD